MIRNYTTLHNNFNIYVHVLSICKYAEISVEFNSLYGCGNAKVNTE